MGPAGLGTQFVTVALAVGAAVAVAALWNARTGRWIWPVRAATVVASILSVTAVIGVGVNRQMSIVSSWDEVFGSADAPAGRPGDTQVRGTETGAHGSRVVTLTVRGRRSHITLPVLVYLPAGYQAAEGSRLRFPVIEAFHTFPGSPHTWLNTLGLRDALDREIRAGRMPPTVVVMPYQTTPPSHDSECVDAVRGAAFDTFLTMDVRNVIIDRFSVRRDRLGWGTIGVSTGGYCALNLTMRHADRYSAAASLSGYYTAITDRTTGDLYRSDQSVKQRNSPIWRLRHLPQPQISVFLACAADERDAVRQMEDFEAAVVPPMSIKTLVIPRGGHNYPSWRVMLPVVLDWIAGRLAGPIPA